MKVSVVCGSHRRGSQSAKVARYVARRVAAIRPGATTFVLDLGETPLPFWDEDFRANSPAWQERWAPISAELAASDAVVLVTPEWGGMATPAIKNFILLCARRELAHKPGLIVTVSGSGNGAYPVAELRATSSKNNQLCYIPEHVIVRRAKDVLNDDEAAASPEDAALRERLGYALAILAEYALALRQVRESGVVNAEKYGFGM